MCFAFDARPPDLPPDLARIAGGAGAELLELESADGTRFSAALAESPEPRGRRGRDPPGRPRALPVLLRARRALRRGRPPRDRDRLLRAHRRARPARRGLRLLAARREDAAGDRAGRRRRGAGGAARAHRRGRREHGRLLLRRHALVPGRDERRARARGRGRLLRRPQPRALGRHVADPPRARDARPGARALRRRRRGHPARAGRGVRARPRRGAASRTRSSPTPGAPHSFFDRRYEEHARRVRRRLAPRADFL